MSLFIKPLERRIGATSGAFYFDGPLLFLAFRTDEIQHVFKFVHRHVMNEGEHVLQIVSLAQGKQGMRHVHIIVAGVPFQQVVRRAPQRQAQPLEMNKLDALQFAFH